MSWERTFAFPGTLAQYARTDEMSQAFSFSLSTIGRCAGAVCAVACLGVCSIGGATALSSGTSDDGPKPAGANVWSGIYSEPQAKRGETLYLRHCAACHAPDLSGASSYDPSPPLVGRPFQLSWNGKSVRELFTAVSLTMPKYTPGSLKPNEYADILAYVFKENRFPAGSAELSSDANSLREIEFILRD